MPALPRLQASGCTNPILDVFLHVNGVLTDPFILEFQIFDISTDAKKASPLQVFPVAVGTRQAVNLAACPTGQKVSTGRFAAAWTPTAAEALGLHKIVWFFKLQSGSAEQTSTEEFDILIELAADPTNRSGASFDPTLRAPGSYLTVTEMRDEGVTTTEASDTFLAARIATASRYIDRATGRFFEPRKMTLLLDGAGHHDLWLQQPIIYIESITLISTSTTSPETPVSADLYRVYNRHLSQGLIKPDDRDNPRIELIRGEDILSVYYSGAVLTDQLGEFLWPIGTQNVRVVGFFGYTDADGTATGATPDNIKHVCKLLTYRNLPKITDIDEREDRSQRFRITKQKTRDQEIQMTRHVRGGTPEGPFTGDFEIDEILLSYRRPMELGAA